MDSSDDEFGRTDRGLDGDEEDDYDFHPLKLKTMINVNILEEEISDLKFHLNRVIFKPTKKLILQTEGRRKISSKYRGMNATEYNVDTLKQCVKNIDLHFDLVKKDIETVYKQNKQMRSMYNLQKKKEERRKKTLKRSMDKRINEANQTEKEILNELCDNLESERENLLLEAEKYHLVVFENLKLRRKFEKRIELLKKQNQRLVDHNHELLQKLKEVFRFTSLNRQNVKKIDRSERKTGVSSRRKRRTKVEEDKTGHISVSEEKNVIERKEEEEEEGDEEEDDDDEILVEEASLQERRTSHNNNSSVDIETLEKQDSLIRQIQKRNSNVEKLLSHDEDDILQSLESGRYSDKRYSLDLDDNDDDESDVEEKKKKKKKRKEPIPEYDTIHSTSTFDDDTENEDDVLSEKKKDEKDQHLKRIELLKEARQKLQDIQAELMENEKKFEKVRMRKRKGKI